jgi:hypothetical protein
MSILRVNSVVDEEYYEQDTDGDDEATEDFKPTRRDQTLLSVTRPFKGRTHYEGLMYIKKK